MELDPIQQAAQEQFARQSSQYGRGHILEDVADVRAALSQIPLPAHATVLDVATGGGHTGLLLASLGHEVILTDLAQPMLDRAARLAAERGLAVTTRQHAAETLPYPDEHFDLVTCRVATHHFSSPESFVRESARVLRPGGCFLLIDGSVPDDQPEAEAWIHALEKWRDPSHHRFLTPRAWRELCGRASLEVQSAELQPLKQPNLDWYFAAAATPPENRQEVLKLIETASAPVRAAFRLAEEDGKITWWWPRLTLIAQKPRPT